MKGIYRITNKLNNKYYLGSSGDIIKRMEGHKSCLRRNSHPNSKLQLSYNKYGSESFIYSIVEIVDSDTTKEHLLKLEQIYLDSVLKENVFNLCFIAGGGGAESTRIPCYILDLRGNVIQECESIIKCYRGFLNITSSHNVNTGMIHKKQFRVVTVEFYNNNLDEIMSWKNYSKLPVLPKKEGRKIFLCINNKLEEFSSTTEVAHRLGINRENVRLILTGKIKSNKNCISYNKKEVEQFIKIQENNYIQYEPSFEIISMSEFEEMIKKSEMLVKIKAYYKLFKEQDINIFPSDGLKNKELPDWFNNGFQLFAC